MDQAQAVEELEIDLLLEGVFQLFGHDFRGYQRNVVSEKLHALMRTDGLKTVSALQDRVLHDAQARNGLLRALSAQPSGLFENTDHLLALREAMVPWLRSCPSPKIWVAECATVEDVGTLAILLAEEGLHDRTQVFATAANADLLDEARQGVLCSERMDEYEEKYRRSGGKRSLGDYCETIDGRAVLTPQILSNITWAQYSLATDASFNEFELIVCRRTLGNFGTPLRRRTLQLFYESLPLFGMLSVDESAELASAPFVSRYKTICPAQGLYRRVV